MQPRPVAHLQRSADSPPLARDVRSAGGAPAFDVFSPPVLLGVVFLLLFGIGVIDVYLFDYRDRLRSQFLLFRGVSLEPLMYIVLSYGCFVLGYWWKPTGVIRHLRSSPRQWVPFRVSILTTVSFLFTFTVLVQYTIQVGYGRYQGQGGEALANLSNLGELSMIPYVFSLVRYAHHRSGEPGSRMSLWDRIFLWGVMFPAQLLLSIVIETRSRVVIVALLVVVAHHYGHRPLRLRAFIAVGVFLLVVVVPILDRFRAVPSTQVLLAPSYNLMAWRSVAGRTSSVETFTIIYENLEETPRPDPLHWSFVMGLIPRFVWPGKPLSTFTERLTLWAVGMRNVSWVGATLPGELLMHLGHAGGLAFMALLGIIWRILKEFARPGERSAWTALYVVALPTLLTVEVGFVASYATLTRMLAVGVLLFWVSTAPAGRRSVLGSRRQMTRPVQVPSAPFRKIATSTR